MLVYAAIATRTGKMAQYDRVPLYWVAFLNDRMNIYSRLPITQTLANSSFALTRTNMDFPEISFIQLKGLVQKGHY